MHGVEFSAGTVFAGYRIDRLLGRGGMGTVYLAAHPRLPRQVALKLLNRELSSDDEVRGRFEREADVSAHLDHPGIVSVLDRGVEDGLMWISMQFVDGTDASVFRREPMDPARAIGIIAQTAEALDYAHDRGVLHRDVKPANILLAPTRGGDRALLTDFGIARLRGDARQLTRTGAFLATLAYASPEQLSGAPVDHRSDQYSLACTLFTLLTGESPFPADNPGAVVAAHLTKPVPRASATVADLPPGLDAVIARAMAKDPAERFSGCEEFARAATAALHCADTPQGVGDFPSGARELDRTPSAPTYATDLPPFGREQGPAGALNPTLVSAVSSSSAAQAVTRRVEGVESAGAEPVPGFGYPPHESGGNGRTPSNGRGAPQQAVSSRWRVLAVSLLVLAMVAGVGAVGVGAVYWKFVRPGRIAPPVATWGEHDRVRSVYPALLPATPSARGWLDSQCFATVSFVVQAPDPVPVRQLTCSDSQGVNSWYTEFATPADADAYLNRHAIEDPATTRANAESDVTAWRARPREPFTVAIRKSANGLTNPVIVEISKPDTTFDSLVADWYVNAPW